MGLLKIELEIPDFKDALEISMTLKRDGKSIVVTESKCPNSTNVEIPENPSEITPPLTPPVSTPKRTSKKSSPMPLPTSGNLMNIDMNF